MIPFELHRGGKILRFQILHDEKIMNLYVAEKVSICF